MLREGRPAEHSYPIMNNKRLQEYCYTFLSDSRQEIETRCFFLFSGTKDQNGPSADNAQPGAEQKKDHAVTINVFYKNPDDVNVRCQANVDIKMDTLVVEQCQDILVSLAEVVPDFRVMSRLDDLYTNKLVSPSYRQPSLQRLLKQQTPFYYVKRMLMRRTGPADQAKVEAYQE